MSSPLILTPWEYWFLKKSLFEASLKFPKDPDDGDGFEYYQVMVDDFIKLDYKLFGDRNEDNPNKWNITHKQIRTMYHQATSTSSGRLTTCAYTRPP